MAASALKALTGNISGAFKAFLRGPEPLYDPTVHTIRGWQKKFMQVWRDEGFGSAYNNLRMSTVHRSGGVLMGTDHLGNRYYEDKNGPYGARQPGHPQPQTFSCTQPCSPPPNPCHTPHTTHPPSLVRFRPHALVRDADAVRRLVH